MTDTATESPNALRARVELEQLRARYDGGAMSPAVYDVIKLLETKISWSQHHRGDVSWTELRRREAEAMRELQARWSIEQ
jgi:hypothetical protein